MLSRRTGPSSRLPRVVVRGTASKFLALVKRVREPGLYASQCGGTREEVRGPRVRGKQAGFLAESSSPSIQGKEPGCL